MHRYNATAAVFGFTAFVLLIYGTSIAHMSEYTLSSSRFEVSGVEYSAGIWARRFNSDFYKEKNENYCKGEDDNAMCTGVRATRAAAIIAVVGSFIASFAAMLVEHFQLEESKGSVGRNVAAALFLISGFWAMIVFYIWQSAVQTDIEDELKQCLEYSFDNARIEMGDSQILVILGWLLCWVAAIAVMQVPKQRYNRRGSGKVAPSKGKIVTNDTLTQSSL